ncbi:aminotransferase class IV [Desulfurobacterium sp.]
MFELFETVKVENKRATFIEKHYNRIKGSAETLKFPFNISMENFKKIIEDTAPDFGSYLVKFSLSISGSFITSFRKCIVPDEVSLMFFEGIKRKNDLLSKHKTSSIYESNIAIQTVKEKGFTEAIIFDTQGFISETALANLFFVKDGVFFTPSLETGCLPGTRRAIVLEILKDMEIPVFEGFFAKEDLLKADEVLITSARYDVISVRKIEDKVFKLNGKSWGKRLKDIMEMIKFE